MNTLNDHVLIYDKDCPLCNLYTSAFIKTKMLDENGRKDFCSLQHSDYHKIDVARSRDEIALINSKTGEVTYGINSMFKILSHRFPVFNILFRWSAFEKAMRKFYSFISYNRKVIAPSKEFEREGSCTPSYNLKYRLAYIVFSWIFTSFILNLYALKLSPPVPPTNLLREWLICGGQIAFQSITVGLIRKDRLLHYLGNMMTVSNMGALLLIPALFIPFPNEVFIVWLTCVVAFMLFEHNRRTKILGLPVWASLSWVLYRLIVLALIFVL